MQYCTCLGKDWIVIPSGFAWENPGMIFGTNASMTLTFTFVYPHFFSKKFHIFKSCNNKRTSEQQMIHLFYLVLVTHTLCSVCSVIFLSRCLPYLCSSDMLCLPLSLVAIPVYVKHNITFREGSSQGRFELTLGPKQTMGKGLEAVLISSQLPRGVLNTNLNPSQGTYNFDPVTKVRWWEKVCVCVCVDMDLPDQFSVCCKHTKGYTVH